MKKEKREKDQYTAVLEEISSKFDLFAESMSRVHEKLDKHDKKFDEIDTKLENITDDLFIIKKTVRITRNDLKQKVGLEEFAILEKRVSVLENKGKK